MQNLSVRDDMELRRLNTELRVSELSRVFDKAKGITRKKLMDAEEFDISIRISLRRHSKDTLEYILTIRE